MFKISQAKKDKGTYCCAYGCSETPVAKKGGLCHKHYARKIRIINPVMARYNQFKNNAIRRGIDFTITYEQFVDFCNKTGYIIQAGKRGYNATIDRIDNRFGYHVWNIQLLTHSQNINKYHTVDKFAGVPF